jgi:hypothetical protein
VVVAEEGDAVGEEGLTQEMLMEIEIKMEMEMADVGVRMINQPWS